MGHFKSHVSKLFHRANIVLIICMLKRIQLSHTIFRIKAPKLDLGCKFSEELFKHILFPDSQITEALIKDKAPLHKPVTAVY